jgi:hypothetical protein
LEQEEAAKSGLDKIARLLLHYTVVEKLHSEYDDIEHLKSFNSAIAELYVKILEYQAMAVCFLGKRTLNKWPFLEHISVEKADHCSERLGRAIPKLDNFASVLDEVMEKDGHCQRILNVLSAESMLFYPVTRRQFGIRLILTDF